MKIRKNVSLTVDDFWYDLFEGGYIKPSDILEKKEDIEKVEKAIEVLKEFHNSVEDIIELT